MGESNSDDGAVPMPRQYNYDKSHEANEQIRALLGETAVLKEKIEVLKAQNQLLNCQLDQFDEYGNLLEKISIGVAIIYPDYSVVPLNAQIEHLIEGSISGLDDKGISNITDKFNIRKYSNGDDVTERISELFLKPELESLFSGHKRIVAFKAKVGSSVLEISMIAILKDAEKESNVTKQPDHVLLEIRDITRDEKVRLKDNRDLKEMAQIDDLTNLWNRAKLIDAYNYIRKSIDTSTQKKLAVAYLDLDKFKDVNDTHGHVAGNEVLKTVAKRLISSTKEEKDVVIRLGGDEFTILFGSALSKSDLNDIITRIKDSIQEPIKIKSGESITVGCSIGVVATATPKERGFEELEQRADRMMYRFKKEQEKTEKKRKSRNPIKITELIIDDISEATGLIEGGNNYELDWGAESF